MPTYELICKDCKNEYDVTQSMSLPYPPCEKCGGEPKAKVSSSMFRLAGENWACKKGY